MLLEPPTLVTKRLVVRLATVRDAAAIVEYYQKNQAFLAPFEPERPTDWLTQIFWQGQAKRALQEFQSDRSCRLFLLRSDRPAVVLGCANFTQFGRGVFYGCTLGYSLAETVQGQGYMTEALQAAIPYIFETLKFHRIMASYMPHNQRSGHLLKRLGFSVEGYARDYLMINGQWQDHILTSLLNPNWP